MSNDFFYTFKMRWLFIFVHVSFIFDTGFATCCGKGCSRGYKRKTGLNVQCGGNAVKIAKLTGALKVGESAYWDADTGSVLFVDMFRSQLHRFVVNENMHYFTTIGNEYAGGIIPFEGRRGTYLVPYGPKLCVLNWSGLNESVTNFECVRTPDPNRQWPKYHICGPGVAPNGAFFFFVVPPWKTNEKNLSSIFSIYQGKQRTLAKDLDFAGGAAWSHDGNWFFWIDNSRRSIYKSYYNQTANFIENTRLLFNYAASVLKGVPDSLTVDADGDVWLGCNGANLVLKLDSCSGEILCSVRLPALQVSTPAFGKCPCDKGEELRCLYVLSTSTNPNPSIFDGALYRIENIGARGVLPYKIKYSTIFGRPAC